MVLSPRVSGEGTVRHEEASPCCCVGSVVSQDTSEDLDRDRGMDESFSPSLS